MKKSSFLQTNKSSYYPAVWILFHAIIFILFGLSFIFIGRVHIAADLFDILPESSSLKIVSAAEKKLSSKTSRNIYILAGSANFDNARNAAIELYNNFENSNSFENISLYINQNTMRQFTDYLYDFRYMLLDSGTYELLKNGEAQKIADNALASAYGLFNFSNLDNIETDPFFLTDREFKYFLESALLSGGRMALKQDVLAACHNDTWYVMIRGMLSQSGVSITNSDSAVKKIYDYCEKISLNNPNITFTFSGVPFHSYESSSNAQREISLITTITLLIIIFSFIYIFRTPVPVIVSVAAISLSCLLASGSVLLIFREIHILTFIFGTTLIGTCLDYSIHYFISWKGNSSCRTGDEIRSHIFRGITLGFISTEICYAILLFAPYIILKQVAVFLLAGLLSSWLTVIYLYPRLKLPESRKRIIYKPFSNIYFKNINKYKIFVIKQIMLVLIVVILFIILILKKDNIGIENNISSLYKMSGKLFESEKISAKVLNHGSSGWYFIISGKSAEEVLQHEEILRYQLDQKIKEEKLKSYIALSFFIPSIKTQKENYEAAKNLLPLAKQQFEYLGFPPETKDIFYNNFISSAEQYVTLENNIPEYLKEIISNLWIGKIGENYYSCLLPLKADDETQFRIIAEKSNNLFFVNKVKDIGKELDSLTHIMLFSFLIAYIVIAVVIKFFYSWKNTIRICSIPFLTVLAILTVFAALNIKLGFFSVVGIILSFGLGVDYIIYTVESKKASNPPLTIFAIFLSFASTAISFGALALSTFVPVHIFGLTVFTGLSTAFICAMLLRDNSSDENHKISG